MALLRWLGLALLYSASAMAHAATDGKSVESVCEVAPAPTIGTLRSVIGPKALTYLANAQRWADIPAERTTAFERETRQQLAALLRERLKGRQPSWVLAASIVRDFETETIKRAKQKLGDSSKPFVHVEGRKLTLLLQAVGPFLDERLGEAAARRAANGIDQAIDAALVDWEAVQHRAARIRVIQDLIAAFDVGVSDRCRQALSAVLDQLGRGELGELVHGGAVSLDEQASEHAKRAKTQAEAAQVLLGDLETATGLDQLDTLRVALLAAGASGLIAPGPPPGETIWLGQPLDRTRLGLDLSACVPEGKPSLRNCEADLRLTAKVQKSIAPSGSLDLRLGYRLRNVLVERASQKLVNGDPPARADQGEAREADWSLKEVRKGVDGADGAILRAALASLGVPTFVLDATSPALVVEPSGKDGTAIKVWVRFEARLPTGQLLNDGLSSLMLFGANSDGKWVDAEQQLRTLEASFIEAFTADLLKLLAQRLGATVGATGGEGAVTLKWRTADKAGGGSATVPLVRWVADSSAGTGALGSSKMRLVMVLGVSDLPIEIALDVTPGVAPQYLPTIKLAQDQSWPKLKEELHSRVVKALDSSGLGTWVKQGFARAVGQDPVGSAQREEVGRALGDWVEIKKVEPTLQLDPHALRGLEQSNWFRIMVSVKLSPGDGAKRQNVELSLGPKGIDWVNFSRDDLRKMVEAEIRQWAEEQAKKQVNARLNEPVRNWFKEKAGKKEQLFGVGVRIDNVVVSGSVITFCARVEVPGGVASDEVSIRDIRLLEATISDGKLVQTKLDTSTTRIVSGGCRSTQQLREELKKKVIASVLGHGGTASRLEKFDLDIRDSHLVLSTSVKMDALGTVPLPVVRLRLEDGSVSVGTAEAIRAAISTYIVDRVVKTGVLENLKGATGLKDLELRAKGDVLDFELKGSVEAWRGFPVTVKMGINLATGKFGPVVPEDLGAAGKEALLASLLGDLAQGAGGIKVTPRVDPLRLEVSGELKAPGGFFGSDSKCELKVEGVRLEASGRIGNGRLTGTCAVAGASIPGTYMALVKPGLVVDLATPTKLGVTAGLTFDLASPEESAELSKKVRLQSTLTIDVKELEALVEGQAILLDSMSLFEAKGLFAVKQQQLAMQIETIGMAKDIIDLSGSLAVDGKEQTMKADGSLKLLGLDIAQSAFTLAGKPKVMLTWMGKTEIPLGQTTAWNLRASPSFEDQLAEASVRFGVGSWTALGGNFMVSPAVAKLKFTVLGLSVTASQPGIDKLTLSYIRSVIESLLKFDVDLETVAAWLKEPEFKIRPVSRGKPSDEVTEVSTASVGAGDPPSGTSKEAGRDAAARKGAVEARGKQTGPASGAASSPEPGEQAGSKPGEEKTGTEKAIKLGEREVTVGRDSTGTVITAKLAPLAYELRRQLVYLDTLRVDRREWPQWLARVCGSDASSQPALMRYEVLVANKSVAKFGLTDGDLVLLRMSDCGAQEGRQGYQVMPENLTFFVPDRDKDAILKEVKALASQGELKTLQRGARQVILEMAAAVASNGGDNAEKVNERVNIVYALTHERLIVADGRLTFMMKYTDADRGIRFVSMGGKELLVEPRSKLAGALGLTTPARRLEELMWIACDNWAVKWQSFKPNGSDSGGEHVDRTTACKRDSRIGQTYAKNKEVSFHVEAKDYENLLEPNAEHEVKAALRSDCHIRRFDTFIHVGCKLPAASDEATGSSSSVMGSVAQGVSTPWFGYLVAVSEPAGDTAARVLFGEEGNALASSSRSDSDKLMLGELWMVHRSQNVASRPRANQPLLSSDKLSNEVFTALDDVGEGYRLWVSGQTQDAVLVGAGVGGEWKTRLLSKDGKPVVLDGREVIGRMMSEPASCLRRFNANDMKPVRKLLEDASGDGAARDANEVLSDTRKSEKVIAEWLFSGERAAGCSHPIGVIRKLVQK